MLFVDRPGLHFAMSSRVDKLRQHALRSAERICGGEWRRFEIRMRRRRVQRLIARAEKALAQGNIGEVTKTLVELRQLDPSLEQITALENALARPTAHAPGIHIPPVEHVSIENEPQAPHLIHKVAIAAAAVALAMAGTELWIIRSSVLQQFWISLAPEGPVELGASVRLELPEQQAEPAHAASSIRVQVETVKAKLVQRSQLPAGENGATEPAPGTTLPAQPAPVAKAADRPVTIATTGSTNALPEIRKPDPAPSKASGVPTVPTLNVTGDGAPVQARNAGAAAGPNLSIAAADHPARDTGVVATSEDVAVQGVLNRYASAYSRLDASAAQEVWPAVNRSALEHAFDGLASQRLLLDHCNVVVQGVTARATCAGSTTWSPKIGNSSRRTEARNWTFQLAKAGSAWQIVSARVQNR
jgi:hypothetical protein